MDITTRLLLLLACGSLGTQAEHLGRSVWQRRGRDALEVYASEFAHEYEPYMFAAIPLHAPVPVVRVLTRAPAPGTRTRDAHAAASAGSATYARPYETLRYYPTTPARYPEPEREERPYYWKARRPAPPPPAYEYTAEYDSYAPHVNPPPFSRLTYAFAPYDAGYAGAHDTAPASAATVLYARPSPTGGYTYRRASEAPDAAASKKIPVPVKEKEKEPPFIFKIHKYRIVKDDFI